MARSLTDDEHKLLSDLRRQIGSRRRRNLIRSRYVDGEHQLEKMPVTVPVSMRELAIPVGWPAKTLTKFSARLVPQSYTSRTRTSLLDDIEMVIDDNQLQYLEAQAIQSAALHGCSFLFVTAGDPVLGEPEVLVTLRDALSASVILDSRTRAVLAALEDQDDGTAILHLPDRVLTLTRPTGAGWAVEDEAENETGRVLCAPYVHNATLQRPLGISRVTKPLMGLTDMGVRIMLRQEVSSEAYMTPRGFLIDAFEEQFEERTKGGRTGWENIIGAFSALSSQFDDETGAIVKPEIQFAPQMSFSPFSEQFRMIAAAVSGETSIPSSYLGVVQDSNPTSAAAVEANEVDLIRDVRGQFPSYNLGRKALAAAIVTALYGAPDRALLSELRGITPRWEDPRTRSVSEQSQFVALQVQAGNFQAGTESTLRQLPIDAEDARLIALENRASFGPSTLNQLLGQTASPEATDLAATETTAAPAADVAAD